MKNYYVWALVCISFMGCHATPDETTLQAFQRHVMKGTTSVGGAAAEAAVALALLASAAGTDYWGGNGNLCGPLLLAGSWLAFDVAGRCALVIQLAAERVTPDTFPPR